MGPFVSMPRQLPGRVNIRLDLDETQTNFSAPKMVLRLWDLYDTYGQLQGPRVDFTQ